MGATLYRTIVSQGCSSCPPALRQEAATWKLARIAINATSMTGDQKDHFTSKTNDYIRMFIELAENR